MERPDPLAPPPGYGQFPSEAAGGCSYRRPSPSDPPFCLVIPAYVFWLGDLSEHITGVELCPEHATRFIEALRAGMRPKCMRCKKWAKIERVETLDGSSMTLNLRGLQLG